MRIVILLEYHHINDIEAGVHDAVRADWSILWVSNGDGRIGRKEESESRDGELKNVSILAEVEFKRLSVLREAQVTTKIKFTF